MLLVYDDFNSTYISSSSTFKLTIIFEIVKLNIISIKSISALGITLVFQIYFQEQVVDKIRNLKLHSEVDADRVHMKNLLMVFLFLIPASISMTQIKNNLKIKGI